MKKKNGFTLVELLLTISMLAVIGSIIIYNTIGLTNDTKELQYERMVENIKNSTKTYVSLYPNLFADLYSSKAFTYVRLGAIVEAGLLDEDTTNPYTKKKIDLDDIVKVYVDGDSYEMVYVYPVTNEDKNNTIWLSTSTLTLEVDKTNIVDLVADSTAEYFYIFDGLYYDYASTSLALVDEEGQLIQDKGTYPSLLAMYQSEYFFSVDIPSTFIQCTTSNADGCAAALDTKYLVDTLLGGDKTYTANNTATGGYAHKYYYKPTKAGTYYITYKWTIPGTKTTKSAVRKVLVVDKTEAAKEKEKTAATTTKRAEEIDKSNLLYDLPSETYLTGSNPVDTDIELFINDTSWSIDFIGKPETKDGTNVLFDLPNEISNSHYSVRYNTNTIYVYTGSSNSKSTSVPQLTTSNKKIRIVLTHEKGSSVITRYIYTDYDNDPSKKVSDETIPYSYNISTRTVVLGGEFYVAADGDERYVNNMKGTVSRFRIYDKVIEP